MRSKNPLLKWTALSIMALIILGISYFRVLDLFELATLDMRFSFRPRQPVSEDIAIVEIAEDSLEQIGRWPFTRDWHAALIDALSESGARAVFFDFIISEPSDLDDVFIDAVKRAGNVYCPVTFYMKPKFLEMPRLSAKTVFPEAESFQTKLLPALKEAAHEVGHINPSVDIDGKIRQVPLFLTYEGKTYPHLSFLVACDYLGISPEEVLNGGYPIPFDKNYNLMVNFADVWGKAFKHYSYADVVKSHYAAGQGEKGPVDLSELKGKVVFVGLTATGTVDLTPIPLQKRYPGIGVHVNLFNTVVTGKFLQRANRAVNILILIVLCLLSSISVFSAKPGRSLLYVIGIALVLIAASRALFAFFGIWIDIFYPLILLTLVYLFSTFYKYIREHEKRILMEKELSIARSIQQSFLPVGVPQTEGLEVAYTMIPARQVGGDLYDFMDLGGNKTGVMIADVSGKGVPASLFMAKTISEFELFAKGNNNPEEVMFNLNNQLTAESKTSLFVTISYLIFDTKSRQLEFASGGHLPTILVRENKASLLDAKEGVPLGLMENPYSREAVQLQSGDIIVLYTDGVTEAMNKAGQEFEIERLQEVVSRCTGMASQEVVDIVLSEITAFSKGTPQHDDITIMAVKVK